MSDRYSKRNSGDPDPLIKSNKRRESKIAKNNNIPSLKIPKIKQESVGGVYRDPLPKTRRSKGKISIPGGGGLILPLAAGKGKIDFVKKNINWNSPQVIIFILLGTSLYLGGIVVTFLLGMKDVTFVLIGIALFITFIVMLTRWFDKAEF